MIAKCPCEHCGVNIEFATEEFLSGSSVTCPKCGQETPLSVSHQAKPAPKPAEPVAATKTETTKNLTPERKPEVAKSAPPFKRDLVALFLQCLTAIAAITCAGLIYQTTHQPPPDSAKPALPRWEYDAFKWNDDRFDDVSHEGKIRVTMIHISTDRPSAAGAQAVDIDSLLTAIGDYGWELVCFDGKHYIVKRPRDWSDGSFSLYDEWQDLPKTK
jgi:hypothetical protein